MLHAVGEYEAGLITSYQERRARLCPPPPRKPIVLPPPAEIKAEPEPIPDGVPVALLGVPNWRRIATLVSLKHGVSVDTMRGPARKPHVLNARNEAMVLIYTHCGLSTKRVGLLFGRDHSTICHAFTRLGVPRREKGTGR
jgi:hypothetical protein